MKHTELNAILQAASIHVDIDLDRICANLDDDIADAEARLATLHAARTSITELMAEEKGHAPTTSFTPTMVEPKSKRHEKSLSEADLIDVRARLDRGETVQSIANIHGVSRGTISNVKLKKGAYA